ncbi:uncharacterized protein MYCFIDRAFT_172926 [Pseudocercospora fijiensis CIRAD86]|uniref:Methyltransferase type 11 domain-containing protein n=1 Tax=Pseudocercospora fijiensis (strain CIRAD86) TaxID=383855 RepID=M3B397_PSEFD|nr:uncharacterized protein MYCFIDRAFT_172926 [Pseudocercospora fijiensis CIRAD86]EME83858.1 hypothetical protein MYCFIDRAFT_172926 [Pseudocercospora fijiensis CIRAD86]
MRDAAEDKRLNEEHNFISSGLGYNSRGTRESNFLPWRHFHLPPKTLLSTRFLSTDRGTYDVVCIRLLHASLEPHQWDEAMKNLVALLKPGGWLQWVDWDPMTARIATVKPGAPDGILRGLLNDYADAMRAARVGNTYRIPNAMRPYLEEEDSDMYTIDPSVELSKIIASGAISYVQRVGKYTSAEAGEVGAKTEQEIDEAGSLCFFDLWAHIEFHDDCITIDLGVVVVQSGDMLVS